METTAFLSPEAYLAQEACAEVRHEYWSGQVVAMAGETYAHNAIKDDLVAALRARTDCDVLSSGLRVQAPGYGRENYAYPDALVICAPKRFDDRFQPPTLLNPTVLIEVTSVSTRSRDYADKLSAYLRIESVQAYWILDSEKPHALVYEQRAAGVVVHMIRSLAEEIRSPALALSIPMQEVYRRTGLAQPFGEGG